MGAWDPKDSDLLNRVCTSFPTGYPYELPGKIRTRGQAWRQGNASLIHNISSNRSWPFVPARVLVDRIQYKLSLDVIRNAIACSS